MDLKSQQKHWNDFAKIDPLWSILADSNKRFNKWNGRDFFETGVEEINNVLNYIQSLKYPLNYKNVLDFGCGVGRLTQAMAKLFDNCYGVDIAPKMIELANQYNYFGKRCKYILNTSEKLPMFTNDYFDLIYTSLTLQHIERQYIEFYLKEFLRTLKPKGILIFQMPSHFIGTTPSFIRKVRIALKPRSRLFYLLKYSGFKEDLLYKRLKLAPRWEIHCLKRNEVARLIRENNGMLLDVQKNNATGPEYISYQYCVTK